MAESAENLPSLAFHQAQRSKVMSLSTTSTRPICRYTVDLEELPSRELLKRLNEVFFFPHCGWGGLQGVYIGCFRSTQLGKIVNKKFNKIRFDDENIIYISVIHIIIYCFK